MSCKYRLNKKDLATDITASSDVQLVYNRHKKDKSWAVRCECTVYIDELDPIGKVTSPPIGGASQMNFERLCFTCTSPIDGQCSWTIVHADKSLRVQWARFSNLVSVLLADPVLSFPPPIDCTARVIVGARAGIAPL